LRECGEGADEVGQFEDGTIYIYRRSACGNGVFRGEVPAVYHALDYPMVMAILGSIFLTVVGSIRET
jgi:hypothetical protein